MTDWHAKPLEEILGYLDADPEMGLSQAVARSRLAALGANTITTAKAPGLIDIFVNQFRDFMVLTLMAATVVAALVGEIADALTIVAILFLNAALGTFQEYRAERALQSLQGLAAPTARVIRGGIPCRLPAGEIVPGDLILLEAGDRVGADARIIDVESLEADESALTGEAFPVSKEPADGLEKQAALGDRPNMLYLGTVITRGRGRAVVVATGMNTQMGLIARMLSGGSDTTPLERRLAHLGRYLVGLCIAVCIGVALLGINRGEDPTSMLLTGVSLAVAAIPEGLPAVVTVALALGVQRMAGDNAIVRRLPAVETLGCATTVCSDKTGTLTQNKMVVTEVHAGGSTHLVVPRQKRTLQGAEAEVLLLGAVCNNATLGSSRSLFYPRSEPEGDPTEMALLQAAADAGLFPKVTRRYRRIAENPFDSQRKMMSVVVKMGQRALLVAKGAPEVVLSRCSRIRDISGDLPASSRTREATLETASRMASRGLRVLAVAERPSVLNHGSEEDLTFVGLIGILDPPRPEAIKAVKQCKAAGIMTVMVTGDHRDTALAIASRMGILPEDGLCLTGPEIDAMSDSALRAMAHRVYVYARVSPGHKMRIVQALKRLGHVVAMTGDGVNDAPAVKEADIGVAMGRCGTDVTREAADMVLADDNFATIIAAVREGRGIYDNIRKFVRYLLACNIGEIIVMFAAAVLGFPLPLIPIQILWVNLVTDGLPAVALGLEPPEEDVMTRPPRPPDEGFFARGLGIKIITRGILIGATTLVTFAWRLRVGSSLEEARTWAFAMLVLCQLWHVYDCRSETRGALGIPLSKNPFLLLSVLLSWLMLAAVLYCPPLQGLFRTVPLVLQDWGMIFAVSSIGTIITSFWPRAFKEAGFQGKSAKTRGHMAPGGVRNGVHKDGRVGKRLRLRGYDQRGA